MANQISVAQVEMDTKYLEQLKTLIEKTHDIELNNLGGVIHYLLMEAIMENVGQDEAWDFSENTAIKDIK